MFTHPQEKPRTSKLENSERGNCANGVVMVNDATLDVSAAGYPKRELEETYASVKTVRGGERSG